MVISLLYSPPFMVQPVSSFTVPCGCHPPPFSAPRDPLPPHSLSSFSTTVPRGCHPHHSLFHTGITLLHSRSTGVVSPHGPQNRHPHSPYRSQPLKLLPSSTLSPRGHRLPLQGREPQDPCTLLPALSPWRADPWLRTPLTPPLKSPPLGNQSGPGHSRRRSA